MNRDYVAAVLRAWRKARAKCAQAKEWYYTHAWRSLAPHVKYFRKLGVVLYASVHNAAECTEAAGAGFLLAIDSGETKAAAPKGWREVYGVRALGCPEQTKGTVTCSTCTYCPRGIGHVVFYQH